MRGFMFTGIITEVGTIRARHMAGDLVIRVGCNYDSSSIKIGESIACNGVCLTVTDAGEESGMHWFEAQVSEETLRVTSHDGWQEKSRINLERSLKIGDDVSGHFVSGHADGLAILKNIESVGASHCLTFEVLEPLHRFISEKGSVTLNGVSLTVNQVDGQQFCINIIPHTWQNTNFHLLKQGDKVNIEVDMFARMIARLIETVNESK